eukprot:6205026-Pleurochrysis_carterae.AAC.1
MQRQFHRGICNNNALDYIVCVGTAHFYATPYDFVFILAWIRLSKTSSAFPFAFLAIASARSETRASSGRRGLEPRPDPTVSGRADIIAPKTPSMGW